MNKQELLNILLKAETNIKLICEHITFPIESFKVRIEELRQAILDKGNSHDTIE